MIYSPSSREEYSFCPRKWWLRKNGYLPKPIDYAELCAAGGQIVSEAMYEYNTRRMHTSNMQLPITVNYGTFLQDWIDGQVVRGRFLKDARAHEFVQILPQLIDDAVSLLKENDPLASYTILGAEVEYPDAGGSRLDVLVQQADGRKVVFDYKMKFGEMKHIYLPKTFDEYRNGEQRLTYSTLAGTDMFGIVLVLMNPTKNNKQEKPRIEVQTWPVREQEKKTWRRDAELMSPEMDHCLSISRAELVRGKTFPHSSQYGPCQYYDACFRFDLDSEKMKLGYVQVER